jgi:hypothetical protein
VLRITFAVRIQSFRELHWFNVSNTAKLRNSRFGSDVYVKGIATEFDKVAKKRFKGDSDANIKFSNLLTDRDPAFGIRNGQLKLLKYASCFHVLAWL